MPKSPADPDKSRKLIRDRAYDAIQAAILDGTFQPGEVLDDAELQAWLGISRTPIRQALYALSIKGLIDMAPQAHTRVVLPRRENSIHYIQATGVLVTGVTDLVAESATDIQRTHLAEILQTVNEAAQQQDKTSFVRALGRYFEELNAINPNPILAKLSGQAMVALEYCVSVVLRESDVPWSEITTQHEELIAAWRAADPETIAAVTRQVFGLHGTLGSRVPLHPSAGHSTGDHA
ncbi:GntR family transcriptional regulator [Diaminobutyricibacter tongyongensis]|uniref:GntR family transcriptional regulator n=1 Tax=Leifsonia tongyongensis TaxID=1268043 RepID=UPI003083F574